MSSVAALPAGRATYGRRREATPLSDSEAPSSSNPKIFETSPANKKKKNLTAVSDEDVDTASTTASGSEDESHARKRSGHRPQPSSTKRLNFLDDSEELSDEADTTVQPGSSTNVSSVLAQSPANGGDAVSRLREKMGVPPRASLKASQSSGGGRSEQYTSSLSSAPPLTQDRSSRQAESSSSSGSDADGEDFGASLIRGSRRGGAMAGRMKKRTAGQDGGSARPSTSTTSKGPSRSTLLLSDEEPSSSPPSSLSSLDQLHRQRVIAAERKARLTELAASKKKQQDQPSLEDEFFGQIQEDDAKRDDPIRSSSSHAYDDDDDDLVLPEISDMIRPKEPIVKEVKAKSSSSKPRKLKEKGPKAPKQLSKKELDEMHKMSAKIERSRPVPSLSLQSHPVQRQQFDFSHLAAKFNDDPDRSLIESQDTEDPTTSDPIVVETPRFASTSVTRESQPSPTQERMLYGNPEAFPPRLTAGPDASLPESQQGQPPQPSLEERQRKVKAAALQLRKQQWLEAQAAAQGPAPAVKARDDDFQIIDRPSGTSTKTQGRKSAPAALTKASFNVSLQDKIRLQNIKARALREQNHRSQQQPQAQTASTSSEKPQQGDDSMEELKRIQQRVERLERAGESSHQEGMEDESDDSEDVDFVLNEDEARGSGSESEEEIIDPDQAPPSSQRSLPSSGSARRQELDDGVEDVDEDEDDADDTALAFPSSRPARARRAVLDDEDLVEDVDANDSSHNSKQDSGISSISTGNSAPGFTQFFQDTQETGDSQQELPQSQRPFITSPDELPTTGGARLGRRPMGSAHRESDGSFGFGQFFQDTQLSQASRGESLDVIGATGRAKNAEITSFLNLGENSGGVGGLSQFFEDDTQAPMPAVPTSAAQAGQMLPPTGIRTDGFAALRKAAQGDNDLLLSPASLPSNDDYLDDEEELLAAGIALPSAQAAANSNPWQYLNREGFFTQTKPSFGSQWQPSQSQTDGNEMGRRRLSAAESLNSIDAEAEPSSTRKKRFRRAAAPEDEDEAEASGADQEEDEPQDEASNADAAGSGSEGEDEEALLAGSGSDEEDAPSAQSGATRNAWDILRQGAANVDAHGKAREEAAKHKKKRDYNDFIEGEALESDEEDEGARKKHGAGGLGGIFSDDGSGSEDEEEDDGRDLEELVNNEREKDELEKDVLARERYYQDLEADDKALMALADKATRGELRKKKRRGDGLEDLLEDDFDEDRLMRRANNPRALMPKRRKIEGDEMDLLASKEESMAFVRGYADTTQQADGNDYGFLQDEDKSEADQDSDDDDDERSSIDGNSHQDHGEADDDEEDEFTSRRITRKDFASELRERRRRKVLLDDDDEPSPSGGANGWGGIDESPERILDPFALHEDAPRASSFKELPSFVRDRLSGSTKAFSRSKEDILDLEDEEESRPFQRLPSLSRPSRSQRAVSPRTEARLKRVAEEFNSQPDFENRAAVAGGSGGRKGLNPGGRSITSFGQQQQRSTSNGVGKGLASRLTADGPMKARVKSSGDTVLLKQRRVVDESQ